MPLLDSSHRRFLPRNRRARRLRLPRRVRWFRSNGLSWRHVDRESRNIDGRLNRTAADSRQSGTRVAPHLNENARTSVAGLAREMAAERDRELPLDHCTGETEAFGPFDAVDAVITLRQGEGGPSGRAAP